MSANERRERPPVGATVRWTSSSNGVTTAYQGTVIYSGPPLCSRRASLLPEEIKSAPVSRIHFDAVSSGIIVRVPMRVNIPHYYAPRLTRRLEIVAERAVGL